MLKLIDNFAQMAFFDAQATTFKPDAGIFYRWPLEDDQGTAKNALIHAFVVEEMVGDRDLQPGKSYLDLAREAMLRNRGRIQAAVTDRQPNAEGEILLFQSDIGPIDNT
jgi:hypothetical protein